MVVPEADHQVDDPHGVLQQMDKGWRGRKVETFSEEELFYWIGELQMPREAREQIQQQMYHGLMFDGYGQELSGELLSGADGEEFNEGRLRRELFPTRQEQRHWVGPGRVPVIEGTRKPPALPDEATVQHLRERHRELGYSGDTARENSAPAVSAKESGLDYFAMCDAAIRRDNAVTKEEALKCLRGWTEVHKVAADGPDDDDTVFVPAKTRGLMYSDTSAEYVDNVWRLFGFDGSGTLAPAEFRAFSDAVLKQAPLARLLAEKDAWKPEPSLHTAMEQLGDARAARGQWSVPMVGDLASQYSLDVTHALASSASGSGAPAGQ